LPSAVNRHLKSLSTTVCLPPEITAGRRKCSPNVKLGGANSNAEISTAVVDRPFSSPVTCSSSPPQIAAVVAVLIAGGSPVCLLSSFSCCRGCVHARTPTSGSHRPVAAPPSIAVAVTV
jgi:hypothetical protein